MTTLEFKNEFDISYNGLASNAAPPLDDYEISVLLTQAQEQIVKNYYTYKGNKYQEGVEQTEKRRRDLAQLVTNGISTSLSPFTAEALSGANSIFAVIEDDTMFILEEQVKVQSKDLCLNNTFIKVVPVTHDQYLIQKDNPFKRPNDKLTWRLDFHKIATGKVVELVYGANYLPNEYHYRYLKFPEPIIVSDITLIDPLLSIDGQTAEQTCQLDTEIHREILQRAVELALEGQGSPRLQSAIGMGQRSE